VRQKLGEIRFARLMPLVKRKRISGTIDRGGGRERKRGKKHAHRQGKVRDPNWVFFGHLALAGRVTFQYVEKSERRTDRSLRPLVVL